MRLALLLTLINPVIGGVLLVGPRGTGKTTAVRSLVDLMPDVSAAAAPTAACRKMSTAGGHRCHLPGLRLKLRRRRSPDLPGPCPPDRAPAQRPYRRRGGRLDERAAIHNRLRLSRGLLARADLNLLYVDEVNLLARRHRQRDPGRRRPGHLSRPARRRLRHLSRPLCPGGLDESRGGPASAPDPRPLRATCRRARPGEEAATGWRPTGDAVAFRTHPRAVVSEYAEETEAVRQELIEAAELPGLDDRSPLPAETFGLRIIQEMGIDSLRAEITLFEVGARPRRRRRPHHRHGRRCARQVAPLALRLRRSQFMEDYLKAQADRRAPAPAADTDPQPEPSGGRKRRPK